MPNIHIDIVPLSIQPGDGVSWRLILSNADMNGKHTDKTERSGHATTSEDALRTIMLWIGLFERNQRR